MPRITYAVFVQRVHQGGAFPWFVRGALPATETRQGAKTIATAKPRVDRGGEVHAVDQQIAGRLLAVDGLDQTAEGPASKGMARAMAICVRKDRTDEQGRMAAVCRPDPSKSACSAQMRRSKMLQPGASIPRHASGQRGGYVEQGARAPRNIHRNQPRSSEGDRGTCEADQGKRSIGLGNFKGNGTEQGDRSFDTGAGYVETHFVI